MEMGRLEMQTLLEVQQPVLGRANYVLISRQRVRVQCLACHRRVRSRLPFSNLRTRLAGLNHPFG